MSVGIVVSCVIAACSKHEAPVSESLAEASIELPQPNAVPAATSAVQAWHGDWFGPEGMALTLVGNGNSKYIVTTSYWDGDKDVKEKFEGTAGPDYIEFKREGILERIRATDGEGTGMKWLADQSNCLTIKEGEGYCRK